VLKVAGVGAHTWVDIPNSQIIGPTIHVSAWILPEAWPAYGVLTTPLVSLSQEWDAQLELSQDKWSPTPDFVVGQDAVSTRADVAATLTLGNWHHLDLIATPSPDLSHAWASAYVDGVLVGSGQVLFNGFRTTSWKLDLGNFLGYIANIGVSNEPTSN
jgi:hypothetical protein